MRILSRLNRTWVYSASSAALMAFVQAAPAYAQAQTFQFDIPSQNMGDTLKAVASVTRQQIAFDPSITQGKNAPSLIGSYSIGEALERLTWNSGLDVTKGHSGLFIIKQAGFQTGETEAGSAAATYESADIIVTAQKREEKLQDVPASITAVSAEDIGRRLINNAQDLSFVVPGLVSFDQGGGRQDITIRGISSSRGTSSLVGIYLDDIPLSGIQDGFTPGYADVRTLDVARVEVLKGPQGTLFGEGAAGGVVRFITNNPDLTRVGGKLSATLFDTADGDFSGQGVGVVNLPIVNDVLGIRLVGTYEDNGGWIDNIGTGKKDFNDNKLIHVRAKMLWNVTPDFSITGLVAIHRNKGGGSNVVNLRPFDRSEFIQAFDVNAPTAFKDQYEIYNTTLNYDAGFANIISSTSHVDSRSHATLTQYLQDPALGTVPLLQILDPNYQRQGSITSQEIRISSAGKTAFKWTVGGVYTHQKLHNELPQGFSACLFFDAVCLPPGLFGFNSFKTVDSQAAFGDASYTVLDRLEIGGGLRYYWDHRKYTSRNPPAPPVSQQGNSHKLTWRAYARYAVNNDINLYFNASTGFRSGGLNSNGTATAPSFGPENVIFYEIGAKARFLDGRGRFEIAGYTGRYKDQLQDSVVPDPTNPSGFNQFTLNAGDAKLNGFEWLVGITPLDGLELAFSGDVIKTRFTSVTNRAPVNIGDKIPSTPSYSLQASANYKFEWADGVPGNVDISYNRHGKQYGYSRLQTIGEPSIDVATPFEFLQASIGADISGFEFSIFAKNLLDERNRLNPGLTGTWTQARPRTIGFAVSKEF